MTNGANESAVELAKARVGATLRGRWRLDRLLGVGGMAAVYAAMHRNGARGAIKVLHLAVSLDAESRRRFLREGYVANAVDHPGAVRVLDEDVTEDGSAYLVMELLEGDGLDALASRRGGKLPPEELLPIADQLLDVLAAAHDKGIVHRDIKPDNIFLTKDGTLKLLDFGIARLRDGRGVAMTAEGTAFGTPAFMAPEQALGRVDEIDGRTDVFSVGATLFALLTGRYVHVTRTLNEQIVAQASKPAPPIASVAPEIPAPVAALVDRALALEKQQRWPDARSMREALRTACEALGWPALPPLPAPPPGSNQASQAFAINAWDEPGSAHTPLIAQSAPLVGTVAPSIGAVRGARWTIALGLMAGGVCMLGAILVAWLVIGPSRPPAPAAPAPSGPMEAPPRGVEAPLPGALVTVQSPPSPTPQPQPASPVVTPALDKPPAASASASGAAVKAAPQGSAAKPRAPQPTKAPDDSWLDRQH